MRRWLCVILLVTGLKSSAQQADGTTLVREYVQAHSRTMDISADGKTIEKALAYCADDLVYEHPAAKAKIEGKEKIREGMTGYLGLTKNPQFKIRLLIARPDVVVAKIDQRFLAKQDDGNWKPGHRSNLTVFEISDGKIRRIIDY